jgi:hypothetical protein
MYWRIRKHGPVELLKKHGVHIGLAISLFLNFLFFCAKLSQHPTVSSQQKTDFDAFIRKVTEHILDTSYVSYEGSTAALIDKDKGELTQGVVTFLRNQQQLPRDLIELRATEKVYTDQRRVSAIRIDEVRQSEPNSQGMITIDVNGVIAVHSAEESDPGPVHFHFKYLVGVRGGTETPIVVDFKDLSG